VGALGALVACADDARAPEPMEIEIGIPDKETRRQFLPLEQGGDVFYFKGLQIEEFVMLAIRIKQTEPEAFVEVTVENVETGATASQPAAELPDPLDCTSDGWCTLAPVLLPARELGALTEINDARLKLHCKAWRDDGARGEANAEGVLRPQQ
jgi:hypothetical protein